MELDYRTTFDVKVVLTTANKYVDWSTIESYIKYLLEKDDNLKVLETWVKER